MRLFRKCIIINIRVFYKILYTSTLELLSAFKIKTNGCFLNNFYMYFNKLQNFLFISIRRVLYCCFAGIPIVLSRDIISIVPYTLRIYIRQRTKRRRMQSFSSFSFPQFYFISYIQVIGIHTQNEKQPTGRPFSRFLYIIL